MRPEWVLDPAIQGNYPIRWACATGHVEMVRMLLEDDRVDPTARDNDAIKLASIYGHTDILELLLKDGRADPTAENNYTMRLALDHGFTENVRLLLQDGRINPHKMLRRACHGGHKDIVVMLLADPRVDPCVDDNIALNWSVFNRHLGVVELLLHDARVFNSMSSKNFYHLREAYPLITKAIDRCRTSTLILIAIRKYRPESGLSMFPKELVLLFAKNLWKTCLDDAWLHAAAPRATKRLKQ